MYKFERYRQLGLADFNQSVGLKMNPENRGVKKAGTIPWDAIEEKYAKLFPSKTGMPAKPLRMAVNTHPWVPRNKRNRHSQAIPIDLNLDI